MCSDSCSLKGIGLEKDNLYEVMSWKCVIVSSVARNSSLYFDVINLYLVARLVLPKELLSLSFFFLSKKTGYTDFSLRKNIEDILRFFLTATVPRILIQGLGVWIS